MPTTRQNRTGRTGSRTRASSRAATQARDQILDDLKDDHRRVKKAYREFGKLDPADDDTGRGEAIVRQVLQELTLHAAVEEQLLYPAARDAIDDANLIDEAEVEHETLHALIDQLQAMSAADDKFRARFTVLCEYVLHHVKEEEGEMFPQLEQARLDWESLAERITALREQPAPLPDPPIEGVPPVSRTESLLGNPAMERITPPR